MYLVCTRSSCSVLRNTLDVRRSTGPPLELCATRSSVFRRKFPSASYAIKHSPLPQKQPAIELIECLPCRGHEVRHPAGQCRSPRESRFDETLSDDPLELPPGAAIARGTELLPPPRFTFAAIDRSRRAASRRLNSRSPLDISRNGTNGARLSTRPTWPGRDYGAEGTDAIEARPFRREREPRRQHVPR